MPCAGGAQAAGSAWGAGGGGESGGLAFHASPAASALLLERVTLNLQASLPVSNEVWLNPGLLVSRMEISLPEGGAGRGWELGGDEAHKVPPQKHFRTAASGHHSRRLPVSLSGRQEKALRAGGRS